MSGVREMTASPPPEGFPRIIIDTREQKPYRCPLPHIFATLETGDYSLEGYESRVVVERKSKADLYGSLGQGRERFEREAERMARFEFAALVIESDLPDLLVAPPHTKMSPKAVVGSLTTWEIRYNIHVKFASDRRHGAALTWQILGKFWREKNK